LSTSSSKTSSSTAWSDALSSPLKINTQTAATIAADIRTRAQQAEARGALLGLSGGIDSALLAALAALALGPGMVHTRYLYDRYSSDNLRRCARAVAAQLEIDHREHSISAAMESAGVYRSFGMRLTAISGLLNRLLYRLYRHSTGQTPFYAALATGGAAPAAWYRSLLAQAEAGMNARHRHRRALLEAAAQQHGWLLLGAANRSEWLVGWFVKGGVDDLPVQPLLSLYKTQVRQLAAEMELPACVLANPPSPDMLPGISDEFGIGLDYESLDLILEHLQGGLEAGLLSRRGIRAEQVDYVRGLVDRSAWKRTAS